jgi:hypothetical protein
MLSWILAIVAGGAGAWLAYPSVASAGPITRVAALLRGLGVGLVAALALNVLVGAGRAPRPLVAIDVSKSWLRGRDSAAFVAARDAAERAAPDSLLAFGDSVRRADASSSATAPPCAMRRSPRSVPRVWCRERTPSRRGSRSWEAPGAPVPERSPCR